MAATFGSAIGGLLFSIEVTATYYIVGNLWKGIFCSVFCVVCFTVIHMTEVVDLINVTDFDRFEFSSEILAFAVLGVICAFIGIGFIRLTDKLINMRKA